MKVIGAHKFAKNLRRYTVAVQREATSILKQEARSLAVELGRATVPGPGFGEEIAAKFQKRIAGDVRKVFASKQDPSSIFALMKKEAPHLAGAYWAAHKSGKARAAADIFRRAGLTTGLDPAAHKAARRGKQGRVNGPKDPVSVATEAQVRAYAKKQMALVGLAKAGWLAAALALGGRVRRSTVSTEGTRGSAEIFPKYVRALVRKFPGLGGARVSGNDRSPRVEIFTAVKHAEAALSIPMRESAISNAREKVKKSLGYAMAELRKKTFAGRS